jgi:hypothetical protein
LLKEIVEWQNSHSMNVCYWPIAVFTNLLLLYTLT